MVSLARMLVEVTQAEFDAMTAVARSIQQSVPWKNLAEVFGGTLDGLETVDLLPGNASVSSTAIYLRSYTGWGVVATNVTLVPPAPASPPPP